jgi:hypothetical protein
MLSTKTGRRLQLGGLAPQEYGFTTLSPQIPNPRRGPEIESERVTLIVTPSESRPGGSCGRAYTLSTGHGDSRINPYAWVRRRPSVS